jgi:hypothetical protein
MEVLKFCGNPGNREEEGMFLTGKQNWVLMT